MSDEPVRIGVLGAGFIARYHALQLALAQEPNRIAAVHDPDRARAEAFAAQHGATVLDDADAVAGACDALVVATWTAAHLEGVLAAAAAGVPVLLEKPLGRDLDEARRIVEVVESAGLLNQVGLVLRSTPALLALRHLLGDGASGAVMQVVLRDDQYLPTQGMYASTWRGDPAIAGSGVLLEHSIHDLDLLEWLLGDIDTVSAHGANHHGIDGIEDSVGVLARFAGGAVASLATVWHDVLSRPSQRRLEVLCERAVIVVEGEFFGPVRAVTSDDELVLEGEALVEWLADRGVPTDSAQQQFLVAVRSGLDGAPVQRLRPDVRDALRAHELVDAVYRSIASDASSVRVRSSGR